MKKTEIKLPEVGEFNYRETLPDEQEKLLNELSHLLLSARFIFDTGFFAGLKTLVDQIESININTNALKERLVSELAFDVLFAFKRNKPISVDDLHKIVKIANLPQDTFYLIVGHAIEHAVGYSESQFSDHYIPTDLGLRIAKFYKINKKTSLHFQVRRFHQILSKSDCTFPERERVKQVIEDCHIKKGELHKNVDFQSFLLREFTICLDVRGGLLPIDYFQESPFFQYASKETRRQIAIINVLCAAEFSFLVTKNEVKTFLKKMANMTYEEFNSVQLAEYAPFLPMTYSSLISQWGLKTPKEWRRFRKEHPSYFGFILNKKEDYTVKLCREDLQILKEKAWRWEFAERIKDLGKDLATFGAEKDWEEFHHRYSKKISSIDWKDIDHAVYVFGYANTYRYLNYPQVNLDHSITDLRYIVKLQEISKVPPKIFFAQIVHQALQDKAIYDDYNAIEIFSLVARQFDNNIDANLSAAKKYQHLPMLGELLKHFASTNSVFSSWDNLRRYWRLTIIIRKQELLQQLNNLAKKGETQVASFLEVLAFHTASNLDMHAVLQLGADPESFFKRGDSTSPAKIRKRYSPENLFKVPFLQLTPHELVKALASGSIDALQTFLPATFTYQIPKDKDWRSASVRDQIFLALGKRGGSGSFEIQPQSQNRTKLFKKLKDLFNSERLSLSTYLEDQHEIQLPDQVQEKIKTLLFNEDDGVKPLEIRTYVVQIHRKSSPEGIIAGDDTGSCDSLGHAKRTDYMIKPCVASFTIQSTGENGKPHRTIAQSVLTPNIDTQSAIYHNLGYLDEKSPETNKILPRSVRKPQTRILTCDNIEVSDNFDDIELVEQIYQHALSLYLDHYATSLHLNKTKFIIGADNMDKFYEWRVVKNTTLPIQPLMYTDNSDPESFEVKTNLHSDWNLQVKSSFEQNPPHQTSDENRGISDLTAEDVLGTSHALTGIKDWQKDPFSQFHRTMNALIAIDIANSHHNQPRLGLKHRNRKSEIDGVLVAYQGKFHDTSCVYVSGIYLDQDMTDNSFTTMVKEFVKRYMQHFSNSKTSILIREHTNINPFTKIVLRELQKKGIHCNLKKIDEDCDSYPLSQIVFE